MISTLNTPAGEIDQLVQEVEHSIMSSLQKITQYYPPLVLLTGLLTVIDYLMFSTYSSQKSQTT